MWSLLRSKTQWDADFGRAYDMLMMTLFNARDRERDDWNQLLRNADRRFKLIGAKKPEVGTMGLIQVVWDANVA